MYCVWEWDAEHDLEERAGNGTGNFRSLATPRVFSETASAFLSRLAPLASRVLRRGGAWHNAQEEEDHLKQWEIHWPGSEQASQ